MKYIMFEDFAGIPEPIIFPRRIDFSEMREQIPYSKVLSAGYVHVSGAGFACHGESKSLQAQARSEDALIIAAKLADPEI
ncbi:MAG: hypothetical protein RDU24_09865 [Humidesulfovibrio sp.]|uniref:hypothetical protein n=1 Tax=Humidesulfovibrio sp. TaxID=2910988 RepID=UPI0027FCA890|nr:hypothetical protein [Humidesulfovibrio sp.]MDQ7835675.1 hypothetical protein [Humidesulfovibrio sp.]